MNTERNILPIYYPLYNLLAQMHIEMHITYLRTVLFRGKEIKNEGKKTNKIAQSY